MKKGQLLVFSFVLNCLIDGNLYSLDRVDIQLSVFLLWYFISRVYKKYSLQIEVNTLLITYQIKKTINEMNIKIVVSGYNPKTK